MYAFVFTLPIFCGYVKSFSRKIIQKSSGEVSVFILLVTHKIERKSY